MSITPREALDELLRIYRDQAPHLLRADNYFRAEASMVNIGSRVPPSLAMFRTPWPAVRIATNAFADRVSIEDIRFEDSEDLSEEVRGPLAVAVSTATLEALAVGTGYVRTVVTTGGLLYTAVRARDAAFLEDLDTSEILATLRVHRPRLIRGPIGAPQVVSVYTPGTVTRFELGAGGGIGADPWTATETVTLTKAPEAMLMRPLINRARAGEPYGRAEARDLYAFQDQGSRALTDLSIATDALAVPQRVLLAANPESFADLSKLGAYMDSIIALSGADVKVDQWQAAQLQPFIEALGGLAKQASAVSGIPLSYWGISGGSNHPSGDAIRETDARLEIRARQIGKQWTPTVNAQATDAAKLLGQAPGKTYVSWMDPATPTPTAAADSAIKISQIPPVNGQPIYDREMIWDILRTPPDDRERLRSATDALSLDQLLGGVNDPTGSPTGPPTGNQGPGTGSTGSPPASTGPPVKPPTSGPGR